MLDKNTRQTIDNARDILVGKVPNPVTQIDLITTAMIYKFMDDMDLENISLGGERVFFVGDLEQYSWSKLLSAAVGNSERISLYTQALEKLPYARQIPQLFRSIFKDAFLPFRDGATLTLFLNEINSLSYNNSENLGDGFEYLLSVMGSQGDAGQFRTPRHIIDFIVEAVNPGNDNDILDPACGTAGFLISAYKYIIKTANEQKKTLSVDAIRQIAKNITGYDIDPTMQKLSLVNLYLHNFVAPKVYEYDTLTSEDRWGDKFDVILANPPFMTPKGGIRPHNKFGIKANKSEVLFVDYFMEHLTLNGRAGFVVPEGIIFQSATAYKSLRKMMVEDNYLYAVVSLPAGVFNPYSGVKTSICFFDRQLAKKTDKILFVEVKNDGFDLGAQRRPIKENDLPAALQAILEYQKSYNNADLKLPDNCLLVEKSKIAENGDYNLTASRYKQTTQALNSKWEMVQLGDVCELESGSREKGGALTEGIPSIGGEQIDSNGKIRLSKMKYVSKDFFEHMKRGQLKSGDVLIVKDGATTGKSCYYDWIFESAAVNEHVFILRAKSNCVPLYLYNIVRSDHFQDKLKNYVKGIIGGITSEIKTIQIPLPPLEVQEEIVKELEGYQAIINGSQEIIDNWKPSFTINPNWPKVKFSSLYSIPSKNGLTKPIAVRGEGYKMINMGELFAHDKIGNINMERVPLTESEKEKNGIELHDLLFARQSLVISGAGKCSIVVDVPEYTTFESHLIRVRLNKDIANPYFYFYYLNSSYSPIPSIVTYNGQAGIKGSLLGELEIYLPSLDEQKAIVDKIAFEEQYIETCKKYIAHFKQKIADKIQSIWSSK
ncbi:MAG: N-6 DNA methylase [Elusimicrobiales bacterium]|nr:N-6 DNA methylase [Elusimicrobiales bacterium]